MTGRADRRRPFAVAIVLIGAIGAALIAPVVIGARRGEPIPGSTVRANSHEAVTIATPLALFATPSVVLEKGTVALVSSSADESRVGALIRTLMLGDGADLVLDRASLVVDRRAASLSALGPAQGGATVSDELRPIVASLAGLKFRSLTLLDTTVAIETGGGTQPEIVSIASVEITPGRDGVVAAKGRLEYRGEPLDIDVEIARPLESAPGTPLRVRAAVKGELVTMSFDGALAAGDHAQITAPNASLSISSVRDFASWLGASWPGGSGLGPFTAQGLLTLGERTVSFEHAEFTLDGNAATGALAVGLGAERPSIEGTLAFPAFDIRPYVTPSRPYALALASDWISAIRIPGVASPSFLRDMDADIRLSANNVTSGSDRLGRGAASVSVRNGTLYGEIVDLELEQGGRGEGQFTVDANGSDPRYTLHGELQDIDLETVVAPRLGPAAIDGAGDIRFDVTAYGSTESELTRSLSGKLSLEMNEGGRLGIDIKALPAAAAASKPVEGWGAVGAGTTTVRQLTATVTAARGVLSADSVQATTDIGTVTALGTVDLDSNALDLVLSIAPAPGDASAAPASNALDAFKIHGSWADPTITRAGPGKAAEVAPQGRDPG